MASSSQVNATASSFKALHKPGDPIVFTNIWSVASANLVASLPQTKALATASFAVAREYGVEDSELTFEQNIATAQAVAKVATKANLPLTVDFQDGYGNRLEEGISKLVQAGVVGINLEDYSTAKKEFFPIDEAASRIKNVLKTAADLGVADFVVNARVDVLWHDGSIDEAIKRGKAYLEAGATTVFVWRRGRELPKEEIKQLVDAFSGRLNVGWQRNGSTVGDYKKLGVARVSLGPQLMLFGADAIKKEAARIQDEINL